MTFLKKLYKNIHSFRKEMSSFKISLWENTLFVNNVIPPGETERKLFISLMIPSNNKFKQVNMCRNPNDTLKILLQRLQLKMLQLKHKKWSQDTGNDKMSIYVDDVEVSSDSKCSEVFVSNVINATLRINNVYYNIIVDAPVLKDLQLGNPPYKGLMLYPYAFDKGFNVSVLKSSYLWFRMSSNDIKKVGDKITYTPTSDDVNCRLKLVCNPCNEQGKIGPQAVVLSSTVQENDIQFYPFEKRLKKKPDNSIRVVSYNILAGDYTKTKEAKNDMYPYCPSHVMASSYRNPLLLKELFAYGADILCLQEVDSKLFNNELSPLFKQFMSMNGTYLKKGGHRNEGLSCFYSTDKFILLEQLDIKLNDIETMEMYCGPVVKHIINDEIWKEGLKKKTVLQVLVLEMISDQKQLFLVCNTHLISDPEGDSIRLLQSLVELTIINKIKTLTDKNYPEHNISILFCGDFNSTPESGVFDLVTKLLLPEEHGNVEMLNELKNLLDFTMNSAYSTNVQYSNYTQIFSGLLDYIYFTNQHLELIDVLPMPSHEDVIQHVGLPSVLFPSDHLALVADFQLKCNANE